MKKFFNEETCLLVLWLVTVVAPIIFFKLLGLHPSNIFILSEFFVGVQAVTFWLFYDRWRIHIKYRGIANFFSTKTGTLAFWVALLLSIEIIFKLCNIDGHYNLPICAFFFSWQAIDFLFFYAYSQAKKDEK